MKPRKVGCLLFQIASNPNIVCKIFFRIKPLISSSLSAPHAPPSGIVGTLITAPESRVLLLHASLALIPLTAQSNLCSFVFGTILGRLLLDRIISHCSLAVEDVSGDLRNFLASSDATAELDKCRFSRLSSEGSVRFSGDGSEGKSVGLDLPCELTSMRAVEEGQIRAWPRDANGATLATAGTPVSSNDGDVNAACTDMKFSGEVETCSIERTDEELVRASAEDDLEQEKFLACGLEGAKSGKVISKRLKVDFPVDLATSICLRNDHIQAAWEHWRKLREPKLIVAPMVDQSELPFRMLCRKYGATAAYTPMLHSRLFVQDPKYRSSEFSTCPEDRPLFVQFCANNPNTLLEAARIVEPYCDYVDINLGCPQRIAKRGNYGAFLMDDLPLIRTLVSTLARNLSVPVS
ncbi:hypothetical protein O6H91_02G103600 [Diphasiastrum complanatum]|nr:hypothetical protein O6H91_02G103600 [Diphasiastrum complanatum]KAJ7566447.1 hypothetical protein O6H91_02G103600 [Diphasiastrum complanatum]